MAINWTNTIAVWSHWSHGTASAGAIIAETSKTHKKPFVSDLMKSDNGIIKSASWYKPLNLSKRS